MEQRQPGSANLPIGEVNALLEPRSAATLPGNATSAPSRDFSGMNLLIGVFELSILTYAAAATLYPGNANLLIGDLSRGSALSP